MVQGVPIMRGGQELEKGLEIPRIELLGRQELPVDGTELFLELGDAARNEALDRLARFRQHAAIGAEARALYREDEALRRLIAPAREALGLLAAVIGAVDLDRGQMLARIFELALLGEALGIERAAPG